MPTALAVRAETQVQVWDGGSFATVYQRMEVAILRCDSVSRAIELEDDAAFWEACAKTAQAREPELACRRIRGRALRRLGKILAEKAADGTRRGRGGDQKSKFRPQTLKLEDLGVDKLRSFQAQRLAKIPARTFEDYLAADMKVDAMIRAHFHDPVDDPTEHWTEAEMPEFDQPDAPPYVSFTINIESKEAMEEFAKLIGQTVTEKTRFINYPKRRR